MTNLAPPIPFGGLLAAGGDEEAAPAALLGVCDATQSTYQDRCASAPPAIRRAYDGACFNAWSESFIDCAGALADRGDLYPDPAGFRASAAVYRDAVRRELDAGRAPFVLGGDHAITPALVSAWAGRGPIHVIQWDAHPDMHPHYGGNPDSHACVAARLLDQEHVASITQIGIRTETGWQLEVREAAGDRVRQIPAWEAERGGPLLDHLPKDAAVYCTFDLDGFDPAFAPAVAHPVPGGLSGRAGLDLMHELHQSGRRLVGMDVVEACPDAADERTLILAARLIHEGLATVVARR